ncbi:MAG TPA: type I polyketide synthase, partial [Bacillota bacterium]|nr:type I polyketide synthase [Bacillota bacterium]
MSNSNSSQPNSIEGIAIIGLSGRFPGARNIREFWTNLCEGKETISYFTKEESLKAGAAEADLNAPGYVRAGGILQGIEEFEPAFFGFNPREAEYMDPQQRFFFESAYEALEDAGYAGGLDCPVGVYGGSNMSAYFLYHLFNQLGVKDDLGIAIANDKDYLATRVSYALNLTGPSVSVQTACSTSLTAVALACEGLLNYHCDMALAGGASIRMPQKLGYLYQEGMIISPDGHTRTFDAQAKGTVFTNAVGVVLLKRLEDALTDGDHIYAVIKGIAMNNDGSAKVGFTAPSREGQAEVIAAAQNLAGVEPEDITYIEAHGTGTSMGDPIEIAALTQVFATQTTRKNFCAVGSVKSNFGHAVSAAGVAGLIKTALAIKYRQIPPTINYQTPNPQIDFANSPFYVNTKLQSWESPNQEPLRAGVSSFGIGGTNVHAVMEAAPPREIPAGSLSWQIIPLAGRTATVLPKIAAQLAEHLQQNQELRLEDVAYTLQLGRKEWPQRQVIVCNTITQALEVLKSDSANPAYFFSGTAPEAEPSVVFVFPEQGAFERLPGQELFQTETIFREAVEECAAAFSEALGSNLSMLWRGDSQESGTSPARAGLFKDGQDSAMSRAAIFAFEYSLAKLWLAWGIKPRTMAGNQIGEYVAACLSGALTLQDACRLAVCVSSQVGQLLAQNRVSPPGIPYLSSVSGTWIAEAQLKDVTYWNGVNRGGRFETALQQVFQVSSNLCLVMGPVGPPPGFQEKKSDRWLASFEPAPGPASETQSIRLALGKLWVSGVKVNWRKTHSRKCFRVPLPTYPFERARYWIEQYNVTEYLQEKQAASPRARNTGPRDPGEWLYYPSWQRIPLAPFKLQELDHSKKWLIFNDSCGLGAKITALLKTQGIQVITVAMGNEFRQLSDFEYEINPGVKADYQSLIKQLFQGENSPIGAQPEYILHLWNVTLDESAASQFGDSRLQFAEACQTRGFFSLMYLAQSLGEEELSNLVRLGIVSNNLYAIAGEPAFQPEKAGLLGPAKVIAREYPRLICQAIDLTLPQPGAGRVQDAESRLTNLILAEVTSPNPEFLVAFRGGQRWRQVIEPIQLKKNGIQDWLKPGGTYLITGGLGGIGLTLAEYLAKKDRVKLVLTRRSFFPPREEWEQWLRTHEPDDGTSKVIGKIQVIEKSGTEVMALKADVSDLEEMRALFGEVTRGFGPVTGVFHAAGVADNGLIQEKTVATAQKVLAPKVAGTLVLDQLLRESGCPPEIFVLFSSSSAVLGNAGFIDYCAANNFLDA